MVGKENTTHDSVILKRIIKFLSDIEIEVIETELDETCVLPGLDIREGHILLDVKRLRYPGDLLHEAGHLAVTPKELRPLVGTRIEMDPAWPSNGDEIGAILWSYAAIRYLDIAPEVVFHSEGYKNESEWIIQEFNKGNYIGLPLLEWMGLCNSVEKSEEKHSPVFPQMKKWLR